MPRLFPSTFFKTHLSRLCSRAYVHRSRLYGCYIGTLVIHATHVESRCRNYDFGVELFCRAYARATRAAMRVCNDTGISQPVLENASARARYLLAQQHAKEYRVTCSSDFATDSNPREVRVRNSKRDALLSVLCLCDGPSIFRLPSVSSRLNSAPR